MSACAQELRAGFLLGAMKAQDVRTIFEAILPDEALTALVEATGLQQRERKLDAVLFLRAAVIAGAKGEATRQASILATYFQAGGRKVSDGAAYGWFSPRFERVMAEIRARALAQVAREQRDLPGLLGRYVTDWRIVDSTTVPLDPRLRSVWPDTGSGAALKVHKVLSVGVGAVCAYHLSPAKDHDSPHLTIDESWRGNGLLADLGYASVERLAACTKHGVPFVIRLKENWKPRVVAVTQGVLTGEVLAGTDLDVLLDDDVLRLEGHAIDAQVLVGRGATTVRCRLVAVPHEGTWRWYLTSLPSEVSPAEVATLYRVRWDIEIDNKVDKSCWQLDEIAARTPETVRALVDAAMVGATLSCLLVHRHRMEEVRARPRAKTRTTQPMHALRTGAMMALCATRIATALAMPADEAEPEWKELARTLEHWGKDRSWRRAPSVLDQLRGWPAPKGKTIRRTKPAAKSVN